MKSKNASVETAQLQVFLLMEFNKNISLFRKTKEPKHPAKELS